MKQRDVFQLSDFKCLYQQLVCDNTIKQVKSHNLKLVYSKTLVLVMKMLYELFSSCVHFQTCKHRSLGMSGVNHCVVQNLNSSGKPYALQNEKLNAHKTEMFYTT